MTLRPLVFVPRFLTKWNDHIQDYFKLFQNFAPLATHQKYFGY